MAGKVVVDGVVCTKPGTLIKGDPGISVRGIELHYASRGGYKLARALRRFNVDVADRVVLDAGASSGGFTDCLLQAGAAKVYAVDVGYGQLRGKLAADDRVISLEKTNIGDLNTGELPDVEFCSVDLSYLTLIKAIPALRQRCGFTDMVCLLKPLYEGLAQEHKDDQHAMHPVLARVLEQLQRRGHPVFDVCPSPLLGSKGAVEFLIYLKKGRDEAASKDLVEWAIQQWLDTPPVEEATELDRWGDVAGQGV
jgi:23S rRNA (cytidine1920-2'-O)/16S rRNA (cytidine1409-2'-O)-methyltransferase|tara:strand:+ start:7706 stop:8461 length:756 start_codon:yes stop_codon:yes gene_type:complete